MEPVPDARLLPGGRVVLAGPAAAPARLRGEVFPIDAGLEDGDDAGGGFSMVERLASREAEASNRRRGNERLDASPKRIANKRL